MRFIRTNNKPWLIQYLDVSGIQLVNLKCAKSRRHIVMVPQAKKTDIVGAERMECVFRVPPEQLLASGSQLLIFVAFDRNYVMNQIAVLLGRPSEYVAQQTTLKNE